MVHINFWASLTLFICGGISALILCLGFKIWVGHGIKGLLAATIIGWFGAWLSATIEAWGPKLAKIAILPAFLGSLSLILVAHTLFPPEKR